jgi:hypothetical protein
VFSKLINLEASNQMDDESKRAKLQVISGGADTHNVAVRNTIKPGTVKSGKLPNGLTHKQEHFARLVAEGANYSDAYRQAFDCDNGSMNTINVSASKLAKMDKVRKRIEEHVASIQMMNERVAMRAVDRWHETLWSIADQSRNDSARVSALRELGKALGLTDGSGQDNAKRKPAKDILADIEAKLGKLTDKQASGK